MNAEQTVVAVVVRVVVVFRGGDDGVGRRRVEVNAEKTVVIVRVDTAVDVVVIVVDVVVFFFSRVIGWRGVEVEVEKTTVAAVTEPKLPSVERNHSHSMPL